MNKIKNLLSTLYSLPCSGRRPEQGGMMVELLLTIALSAVILPFVIGFQSDRVKNAENIALSKKMDAVKSALERYIDINQKELLSPIGKNITRVKISDLADFGAPDDLLSTYQNKFQVRILKSSDSKGRASLQGIIVLQDKDISPLRTREIIHTSGDKMGFVEGGRAFGAFGTWRVNTADVGISGDGGIVETTKTRLSSEQYLYRLPSTNISDATMLNNLNIAGHNITDTKFLDSTMARFEEIIKTKTIIATKMTFQNRTTIDKTFDTGDATVTGALSADSKNLDVNGTFNLADAAKLSGFTADNLWVTNLNLPGLSISSTDGTPAILRINQALDMVAGRINATTVTVGFTGSITPKLVVKNRIEDSTNSGYYWDTQSGEARLSDATFAELNRMAALVSRRDLANKTSATQTFGAVVTNKNATAADFINAVSDIQRRVRAKYQRLNLE